MSSKKIKGLLVLLLIYVAATFIGYLSFSVLNSNMDLLLRIFIADAIATVFIWVVGVFLKSASIWLHSNLIIWVVYYLYVVSYCGQ